MLEKDVGLLGEKEATNLVGATNIIKISSQNMARII